MKNKFMKCTFMLLFLLLVGIGQVSADSKIIDFSRKGSIKLSLIDNSNNAGIYNSSITIYKIADASLNNYDLVYKEIDELSKCNIDLSKLSGSSISNSLVDCVKDNSTYNVNKYTNKEGIATFNNLDLGIYLIIQTNKVEGYSSIDPFLIAIPQEQDGNWIYDIDSMPKTDIYRVIDINVKKVWNNEGRANPKSITIELINNGDIIDTIVLSDENNWNYTWQDMELDDKYSVREKDVPNDYVVTYQQDEYNFIVTNTRKLPQTGLQIWLVEFLAIIGIISLIIGIVLSKKYENNK